DRSAPADQDQAHNPRTDTAPPRSVALEHESVSSAKALIARRWLPGTGRLPAARCRLDEYSGQIQRQNKIAAKSFRPVTGKTSPSKPRQGPWVRQLEEDKHELGTEEKLELGQRLTTLQTGARRIGSVALRAEGRRHRRAGDQRWSATSANQCVGRHRRPGCSPGRDRPADAAAGNARLAAERGRGAERRPNYPGRHRGGGQLEPAEGWAVDPSTGGRRHRSCGPDRRGADPLAHGPRRRAAR